MKNDNYNDFIENFDFLNFQKLAEFASDLNIILGEQFFGTPTIFFMNNDDNE